DQDHSQQDRDLVRRQSPGDLARAGPLHDTGPPRFRRAGRRPSLSGTAIGAVVSPTDRERTPGWIVRSRPDPRYVHHVLIAVSRVWAGLRHGCARGWLAAEGPRGRRDAHTSFNRARM